MDLLSFPPIAATLDAAYGALMWMANLLEPLAGSASAAAAVILVTLLVRAALIPTGIAQAKAEQTRARIAPRLLALRRKHKNDRERLQRETMKPYADEHVSPFAGCLPVAIQTPIVGVLYALFLHSMIAGHPNALLAEQLLGVPLGLSMASAIGLGQLTLTAALVFGILISAIALVAELTRRLLRPPATSGSGAMDAPSATRLVGMLHFATAVAAIFIPLAAGLYLLVTVTWTLAQRLILRRIYPLT